MNSRVVATIIAVLIVLVGIVLFIERGGVLAIVGIVAGAILLVKIQLRPASFDLGLGICVAAVWALVWGGTFYYVISTWESGEVVELTVDGPAGPHTARVWVLDTDESVVLYYDAEPGIAQALLSGKPIQVIRAGQPVVFSHAEVEAVEEVSQQEMDEIYQLMLDKYEDRNAATEVFYQMLGGKRDRIAVVITLEK